MDKSWMGTNRTNKSYADGVASFIDYAVHNLQKMGNIDLQTRHGEKDEPSISSPKPVNATIEFVDDTDFASDILTDGPATVEMVNATKDNFDKDDLVKFQELLLDVEKPLYEGCPDFTKLSAIVKLLNLKGKYGASDKFFIELRGLIKKMLPAGNEMVEKTYQAKKVMKLMGPGYKKIHVCINNCLLYWKDDKDLIACQTYGISRWKVDNKTHKVYKNIPAKRITDGVLRHPADSQAWRTIDEKFPKIAEDPRNLRLGISADGVDVNTGNRHHSVWPVLTVIYNLPPWLWVDTYDVSTKDNFNLCAVVLWTINDYPALGTLCGCPYSGFKGCVVCGKDTNCVRLSASSKQSYVGHRRYLPYNHPFRKQKKAFNGQQEFLSALILMIGNKYTMRKIQKKKINTTEEEGSSSQVNGQNGGYWKKFNIWYRKLRYWRHNSVPHCINFMHVEKNVAESLVRTLLHVPRKTKDGVNDRLDLAELGVKLELFVMKEEDKKTLPPPGYTLTNAEKDTFCETLYNIRGTTSKEIILQELDKMQEELVVTLCLLEKFFPLSFFDIMIHLTVHLTREVERELAISKESVSETVRWISYGPRATVVKYDAYNINGYTFRTKCHDGKVYQNSGVSVEAIDLHISKEVATTRQAFYYGVLQEIWVLDYRFRQIPLFKCDWVNHRAGGVKRDNLGYTLVDLNNLGHKVDPFILASQARQVFYVKDQIDKKLSIVFKTPPKNYKDTYDEVDEEFSTVIHQRNDNILPCVNRRDLGNESRDDYYRTDCGGVVIRKSK
ncbi:putative transposase-associated domain-containing protein [Tanacetum coccineum]|uniref:Transposase-associated domain-containing protein n=1 Tax=Tanacetum coccineum TaxID=301880 RepID=A0ABQ4YTV1_9ASTR